MIFQRLKEEFGYKLINNNAKAYKEFIENYSKTSGRSIYSATNETIENSDTIIMIGTRISRDNPGVKYAVNKAVKKQRADFIYMHPIDDIALQNKYNQFIKYEVGSEEGVIALLASYLIKDAPAKLDEYLEDLDIGYLSGECSVGEEELELITKRLRRKQTKTLIIGEDIYAHPNAKNIAKLVGVIDKYSEFNVVLVPSSTNTLGVSLICDLDDEVGQKVIGYNELGDFNISDNGTGDFQVPALNQQEGTFVNIDKKVVNTNVALPFDGYCLNDIANELFSKKVQNTIDYTSMLPVSKGFKSIDFDSLENGYNKYGKDLRGYSLSENISEVDEENFDIEEVEDIDIYNGTVIYRCESLHQFNKNTGVSLLLKSDNHLRGSSTFAMAAKIKDGDKVSIRYNNQITTRKFKVDSTIKGTVALYPTFDNGISDDIIDSGYRYKQVQIQKVDA